MRKKSRKFLALLLSLMTLFGSMATPAFAMETIDPGAPGSQTERYIDEAAGRELAPPATSKSSWVKEARQQPTACRLHGSR